MTKKPKTVALLALILISVTSIFLLTRKQQNQQIQTNSANRRTSESVSSNQDVNAGGDDVAVSGRYIDYSVHAVATTKGTRILFFHAPWCPQCRSLDSSIQNGAIPSGVTIFKVDYDSNFKLRQKYGVTIQTTLVKLAADGSEQQKFVAYDDPSLVALEKALL